MSIQLIQQYQAKVEQIIRFSGSRNESSLRKPFQDFLEQYASRKIQHYHFADYKELVIDLLLRVCRVSVETMKIVEEMPK
jgi:hypothetical protein